MVCCHVGGQEVELGSRSDLRVVDLLGGIGCAVVIGMESAKEESDGGPFLEEVDLIAPAKDSFFVEFKFEIDRFVGF